jgi:hypothetical protein
MRRWKYLVGAVLLGVLLTACDSVGFFKPMPDDPSEETARSFYQASTDPGSLLVIGDWGSGTIDETEIASDMEAFAAAHPVQAILTTGDNFYTDDPAEMLHPFDWANRAGIDFWVTWGNHDIESRERIEAVNTAFGGPPRWATIPWGETQILILDSNEVGSNAQLAYLQEEMTRIDAPTIVVFHHPPFSCSDHVDNESVIEEWLPLFDDDVILVLNGHAHTYQRFDRDGVPYVVSGGGGRELDDLEDCPGGHLPQVAGEEAFHFLTLTQEDRSVVVTAIDDGGETIDRVSLPLGL